MNDAFASLYGRGSGLLTVPNYAPPEVMPHGDWVLVAECPKSPPDGDGQAVRVYESRLPATFYRIEALPDTSSVGDPINGLILQTGSGMHKLVDAMVEAITTGMLGEARGANGDQ